MSGRNRKQAPRTGNLTDSRFEERRPRPWPTGSGDASAVAVTVTADTTDDEDDIL